MRKGKPFKHLREPPGKAATPGMGVEVGLPGGAQICRFGPNILKTTVSAEEGPGRKELFIPDSSQEGTVLRLIVNNNNHHSYKIKPNPKTAQDFISIVDKT